MVWLAIPRGRTKKGRGGGAVASVPSFVRSTGAQQRLPIQNNSGLPQGPVDQPVTGYALEHDQPSEPFGSALTLLSKREAITNANAACPLLPGAVRGAQFHPRSPLLRRLATLAHHRHQRAGAGAGRSGV